MGCDNYECQLDYFVIKMYAWDYLNIKKTYGQWIQKVIKKFMALNLTGMPLCTVEWHETHNTNTTLAQFELQFYVPSEATIICFAVI